MTLDPLRVALSLVPPGMGLESFLLVDVWWTVQNVCSLPLPPQHWLHPHRRLRQERLRQVDPSSTLPSSSPSPVPIVAAISTNQIGIVSTAVPGVCMAAAAAYHKTNPLELLGPTAQLHRASISNSTISPLGHEL